MFLLFSLPSLFPVQHIISELSLKQSQKDGVLETYLDSNTYLQVLNCLQRRLVGGRGGKFAELISVSRGENQTCPSGGNVRDITSAPVGGAATSSVNESWMRPPKQRDAKGDSEGKHHSLHPSSLRWVGGLWAAQCRRRHWSSVCTSLALAFVSVPCIQTAGRKKRERGWQPVRWWQEHWYPG